MSERSGFRRTLIGIAAALWLAASANASDPEWKGELGLLGGNHDNFFFRGTGSVAPSSDLVSGYFDLERTQRAGAGKWTLLLAATMVSVQDIDDADYQILGLATEYKRGPWKAALGYEQLLNRLFSESGEAVFFDEVAVDFWLRYSFNSRVWLRLKAEFEDWNFDSLEDGRDSEVDKYSATVRIAATDRLGLRFSWLEEERAATGAENNRSGNGFSLALEGSPRHDLTWFLRYRSRDRDYEDAPAEDRNFQRSDSVNDVSFNLRWLFGQEIGLVVRDNYRSGDSTRLDRNFTGNVIEAGLFFQFGSTP